MEVRLFDSENKRFVQAEINVLDKRNLPAYKNSWQFNWRKLARTDGAEIYQISLIESTSIPEGLIMLSVMNGEMLYMNNIEVAPHNIGRDGTYDLVAGCLIAFGCRLSFEKGKDDYKGYLTFESKTELISLYQEKYQARIAMGNRMYIEPEKGLLLMGKYLQ